MTLQNMINAETSLSSLVVPLKKLQSDAQNTCVALALNRKTYTNSDTDQVRWDKERRIRLDRRRA
jgi:hypothetical protein